MTTFAEILMNYAKVEIDDINWDTELAENPAQFYRSKSLYMFNAIPRFNRPPNIATRLAFTPPTYDDYLYTSPSAQTSPISIDTGILGYELCSAGIVTSTSYTPISVLYDDETGIATLNIDLAEGQMVDFDFYTDGQFTNDLTYAEKRILGLCVQLVWENRFANSYLVQSPKIKSKSFDMGNEGTQSRANTERLTALTKALNGEILAYEQSLAYINAVPPSVQLKFT